MGQRIVQFTRHPVPFTADGQLFQRVSMLAEPLIRDRQFLPLLALRANHLGDNIADGAKDDGVVDADFEEVDDAKRA